MLDARAILRENPRPMSRLLVTGATGFLGRHVVQALLRRGHDVVALCRADSPSLAEEGVDVRRGDVCDESSVRAAADGCDGALCCAGFVSRDPADAERLHRVHVEGTQRTLDACRAAGVRRVVVASTSGTLGVGTDPRAAATEESPSPLTTLARWPYYRAKLFAERAALDRNDPPAFEVVCVNPSLLLGPGDLRGSSTEDVRRFLERKIPAVPAGGLSFVDVRDAAEGMVLAFERGRPGARYLLGAANMTVADFFGRLSRISGVAAPPLRMLPSLGAARAGFKLLEGAARLLGRTPDLDEVSVEMAQHFWYIDSSRAVAELGFRPRDPGETLSDTVHDLEERGVVWPESA